MVRELRELHDRIDATTVYVTHDQLEAMAMADKIAVMNHGVVEQFGTPQEIYDRPATHVRRRLHRLAADELPAVPRRPAKPARRQIRLGEARGRRAGGARGRCADSDLASASGPSMSASTIAARLRGEVFGAEYLGTTQIVTVTTRYGAGQGAVARRACRSGPARRSGSTSGPNAVALRQGVRPGDPHRAA